MRAFRGFLLLAAAAVAGLAQMTADQKVADFTSMSQFYVRHYTPANWKTEKFGFDLRVIAPWLTRVRATQNDLEYFDVCIEYLASLKDGHIRYSTTSFFQAYLLFDVDLYDNRVLVEFISSAFNRTRFPMAVGDEVVSVDGVAVNDLIQRFAKYGESANERSTRRRAADFITFRPQSAIPSAGSVGDTARVVLRRASGQEVTYDIPWSKFGEPIKNLPPTAGPFRIAGLAKERKAQTYIRDRSERFGEIADAWGIWRGERAWFPEDPSTAGEREWQSVQNASAHPDDIALIALGQPTPLYNPPPGFQLRLGARPTDLFVSGTFPVGNQTVGWIRIYTFLPASTAAALAQFRQEMIDLQAATSALVIDVMHNPGGNVCYAQELMRYLAQRPFWGVGYWIKPTAIWVQSFDARFLNVTPATPAWERQTLELYKNLMRDAADKGNEIGVFPICSSSLTTLPQDVTYTKPILMLTNEFSVSAGDTFPMMFQDAQRGRIVGFRTGGLGGNVNSFLNTGIAEANLSITRSLITRERPVEGDLGPTRFIENAGVRPNAVIDIMTRENLLTGGAPFVAAWIAEVRRLLNLP